MFTISQLRDIGIVDNHGTVLDYPDLSIKQHLCVTLEVLKVFNQGLSRADREVETDTVVESLKHNIVKYLDSSNCAGRTIYVSFPDFIVRVIIAKYGPKMMDYLLLSDGLSVRVITVTEDHKAVYEKSRQALMVPDPWSDPFSRKIGLNNMYIESSLAEIMYLRAELEPGVKLNCPNPIYTKFHTLLNETWKIDKTGVFKDSKSKRTECYIALLKFLESDVLHHAIEIVRWCGYIPDIRLVDNIDEAVGWLAQYIDIEL